MPGQQNTDKAKKQRAASERVGGIIVADIISVLSYSRARGANNFIETNKCDVR